MNTSLSFHIIGIVMWVGGLIILTRMLTLFSSNSPSSKSNGCSDEARKITRRLYLGWVLPGFVIVVFSGMYQLGVRGMAFYFSQSWFHGKAALVLVLFFLTILVGKVVKNVSENVVISKKMVMSLHGLSALILVAVVFITFHGR